MSRRPRPPRSPYQRLALGFLGVVVLLAVGVLLLSIARVEVRITPRQEPITADFDVTIIGSGTPTEREVLGRLIRVEGTGTAERVIGAAPAAPAAPSAPTAVPPTARAEGVVTIVNTHTAPQPLVATTRLLSPAVPGSGQAGGVLFRLKSGVMIPAKGKRDGVAVYADQPGIGGEIGPTKFSIPGLSTWLQARVWAESTEPMRRRAGAATVAVAPVAPRSRVAEADLAAVREQAVVAAKERARQQASTLARDGEEVVPIEEAVRVTVQGAVGEVRDRVAADATVVMTAILVPVGALEDRVRGALEDVAAASGRELRRVRGEQRRTRIVSQDPAAARATIAVHAEGDASLKRGSFAFEPRRIAGFTAEEVQTYLRSIPGVQDVEVQLRPFWVKRVPASVGSVNVEVTVPE